MRLKKCRSCKTTIPANARRCPYCFKVLRPSPGSLIFLMLLFVGSLALGYVLMNSRNNANMVHAPDVDMSTDYKGEEDVQPETAMETRRQVREPAGLQREQAEERRRIAEESKKEEQEILAKERAEKERQAKLRAGRASAEKKRWEKLREERTEGVERKTQSDEVTVAPEKITESPGVDDEITAGGEPLTDATGE